MTKIKLAANMVSIRLFTFVPPVGHTMVSSTKLFYVYLSFPTSDIIAIITIILATITKQDTAMT